MMIIIHLVFVDGLTVKCAGEYAVHARHTLTPRPQSAGGGGRLGDEGLGAWHCLEGAGDSVEKSTREERTRGSAWAAPLSSNLFSSTCSNL